MKTTSKPNLPIFFSLLWDMRTMDVRPTGRTDPEPRGGTYELPPSLNQKISKLLPDLVEEVSGAHSCMVRLNDLFTELRDNHEGYDTNPDDRQRLMKLVKQLGQFDEEAKKLQAFLKQELKKRKRKRKSS